MKPIDKKKLLDELGDALMSVNSAECVFIGTEETDCPDARKLSEIWHQLYVIRKRYKDGLDSKQSKGETEKTA